MIYKLIILIASIFMIYEFTKKRSTAVAQIEPKLSQSVVDLSRWQRSTTAYGSDITLIRDNEQSFKNWVSANFNFAKRGSIFTNGVLDAPYVDVIQKNDTAFFAWRNSVNNAWLKLNGV